jgi:uncharacterized membrane protein (DUF106 family)
MVSGFQTFVDTVFNPLFGWLLNIPPLLAILFLSLLLGLISTLLQKYLTDQEKMRRLKDDTKKMQKQMKEAQKEKDADKVMKLQGKLMPIQMDLMKESFRPLLWTMLPFLLIFFWLNSHFGYYPVEPGVPFSVTAAFEEGLSGNATLVAPDGFTVDQPTKSIEDGKISWTVSGPAGEHTLRIDYAGAQVSRTVLVTTERAYLNPVMALKGPVNAFNIGNAKLYPAGKWNEWFGGFPGWIFWYIILSIPISLGLKKILKVV